MKTFKEFQEGLFDFLPKSKVKGGTPVECKPPSCTNFTPVAPGPDGKRRPIKYNMPVIPQQTKPTNPKLNQITV